MNFSDTVLLTLNVSRLGNYSREQPWSRRIVPVHAVVTIIISLIGAPLNGLLLYLCYRKHQVDPSPTGFLVVQMVAAWLILTALVFPLSDALSIAKAFFGFHIPNAYCVLQMTASVLFGALSKWTEVVLAFNRLVAISFPYHFTAFNSRRVIFCMMAMAWLFASCAFFPIAGVGGIYATGPLNSCIVLVSGRFALFLGIWLNYVTAGLIGICCMAILAKAVYLRYRHRQLRRIEVAEANPEVSLNLSAQDRNVQRRTELAMMIVAVFAFNTICSAPFIFVNVVHNYLMKDPNVGPWLTSVVQAQYSINPLAVI
ncbi:hypothetical protein BV898_15010 [Hypsibius exemplaris]|uniref:G-protein coupled receptors family 1 profile domain-containing protein n=1 Tax=Hypsibius exemplaris TaxID=2072580 RepID=A0A9X6RK34_HYPEX|nr:hypothetical protein BV898_15010 [Hypsibius exemplaris]